MCGYACTDAVVVGAGLEPLVAVAGVGAGQVLARAVATQRPRARALVHVATRVLAQRVARRALAAAGHSIQINKLTLNGPR